jgi:hypothetical protein
MHLVGYLYEDGRNMLVTTLRINYIINIEVHLVGYL